MLTRKSVLRLLQENYGYLADQYGVRRVGVFGSYAKGLATNDSDVDIFVEFERPIGLRFVELVDYLEQLLGTKVDVLTPGGLRGIRIPGVARSIEESIVYVQPKR